MVRCRAVNGGSALVLSVALLAASCGARSEPRLDEPRDGDQGTPLEPNSLCASVAPGEVVTLFDGTARPAEIAVSGESLVVAEGFFTGDVFRMPRTGGGATSVLADAEPAVTQLIADREAAYWLVNGYGDRDGALRSASTSASFATTEVGVLTRPQGLARFGDYLYFTDGYGPPNDAINGRVQRLKLGERTPTLLASGLRDPWAITVDATGVYFSDGRTLFRLPHSGGTPEFVATPASLANLATDGQHLFWSTGGVAFRRDHATGTVKQVAESLGLIQGFAADARGAYLVQRSGANDFATGGVYAIREADVELLAATSDGPLGIAIDARAIYFTSARSGAGSVKMLCRPP
jgi:hypothetical protein